MRRQVTLVGRCCHAPSYSFGHSWEMWRSRFFSSRLQYLPAPLVDGWSRERGMLFGRGSRGEPRVRTKSSLLPILPLASGGWVVAAALPQLADSNGCAWAHGSRRRPRFGVQGLIVERISNYNYPVSVVLVFSRCLR